MPMIGRRDLLWTSLALALTVACGSGETQLPTPPPPPPPSTLPPAAPPGIVPLTLTVSPSGRRATVLSGGMAPDDNATVTFSGGGAATAAWVASASDGWLVLRNDHGVGSTTVTWSRNTVGLLPGIHIATIAVTTSGAPATTIVDTVDVVVAPVARTLNVSPRSRSTTTVAGSPAPSASVVVSMSGDGAESTTWTATRRQPWTTLAMSSGVGSSVLAWNRNVTTLSPGTYVDTITVSANAVGSPLAIIDSVVISPAPVPLSLAITPSSHTLSIVAGGVGTPGVVAITLNGSGSASAVWVATHRQSWNVLSATSGMGGGPLGWTRSLSALVAGVYVDTVTITVAGATGSPARFIDSAVVAPAPLPLQLSVAPASRSTTIVAGGPGGAASAAITLSGTGASSATWTATKRKAWTTLTTAAGSGNGTVAWSRNATGLSAGIWVDTITTTAPGATGSPSKVIDSLVVTAAPPPPPPPGAPDIGLNADLHGKQIFPAGNLWNQPVDTAQVDPASAGILGAIGLTKSLHPDFGASYNGGPFGIPYIVVPDNQARITVPFTYADESDAGPYPIPANPPIEPGGGDSHLLMITQSEWKLYELYATVAQGAGWRAGSGAIWNLATGAPRPAGWTSADAAGLPILPGLVRYDEVVLHGEIDHALRFTVARTRRAYVAPASHVASASSNALYAPMGMRVRLKASFNISGYPAAAQVILRALKKYGMMVADNGSDFYLSGTADARWNDTVNNTLKQVKVSDFEVVKMGPITVQ